MTASRPQHAPAASLQPNGIAKPHLPQHSPDLAAAALKVAVGQIGIREAPLGSNAGPVVDRYLASVGLAPGFAWCAAFAYWCVDEAARQLGLENPLPRTGGCLDLWARAAELPGIRVPAAKARTDPARVRPGLLFVHDHGGGEGHVGFVRAVDGPHLVTVEGNTSAVGSREGIGVFALSRRRLDDSMLLGFLDFGGEAG